MGYNLRLTHLLPGQEGPDLGDLLVHRHARRQHPLSRPVRKRFRGTFFMRLEIEGEGFGLARDEFAGAFAPLARRHGMDWRLSHTDTPKRMAILVSRHDHCLIDLLWRWDAGRARRRDTARRLQPPRPRLPRRGLRHPLPPPAGHQGDEGGAGIQGPGTALGARRRPRRARPLHADPHARVRRTPIPTGSSTSTTRSSRPSRGPTRTAGRTSGA